MKCHPPLISLPLSSMICPVPLLCFRNLLQSSVSGNIRFNIWMGRCGFLSPTHPHLVSFSLSIPSYTPFLARHPPLLVSLLKAILKKIKNKSVLDILQWYNHYPFLRSQQKTSPVAQKWCGMRGTREWGCKKQESPTQCRCSVTVADAPENTTAPM